ncbi:MAG TPA: leucyl aminopeptidase [Candidatus Methylomirabilis sp.]|nr:leucyl aminopeptidase [Candidatus Methylomirabilis sp.]HSB81286.1 leucyl aminopeptidase [Candidatus Methylomirabilis sp.]
MEIRVVSGDVEKFRGDALVVNLFEGGKVPAGTTKAIDVALGGAVRRLIRANEATGRWCEQTLIHTLGRLPAERVLVVGLGKPEEFTLDRARMVSADAARCLRKIGARRIGSVLHGAGAAGFNAARAAQALVEGSLLGLYRFARYRPRAEGENAREIESLTLVERDRAKLRAIAEAIRRGRIVAEATNAARDLVNEPGNTLTPTELARRAREMIRGTGVRCRVLGPQELRRLRCGALLGVARGSQEPPRLIVLDYAGARRRQPHLGLVGKGITFDSGGISIKPAEHMESMKGDMAGAAAVIAATTAIARLKLPIRLTTVVPATENLPSGSAMKPGDILRAMSGKTIEVINTDAEGRLVLADALHYARGRQVTHLVDAATLTGACVVGLGTLNSGAFTNNQALLDKVLAAGRGAGERIWPMPMDPEYGELIKSEVAEIKNTGGRKGGAITGAKFLEHFVGDTPWVHLDIAGTFETDKEKGYQPKGATGVMVRTFVNLAVELLSE